MIQMTDRDEAALDWLGTVRIADMEGVRWVLGALNGSRDPVTLRKAQRWVARMKEVGAVDSGRPTFRDGSLLWSTHAWTGESRPNLYRQTTRHEVAVSIAAARFLESVVDPGAELDAIIAQHYLDAKEAMPSEPDVAELEAAAIDLLVRAADRASSLGSPEEAVVWGGASGGRGTSLRCSSEPMIAS